MNTRRWRETCGECFGLRMEFMMAGATVVAVGTANSYEPRTALQVIAGLREFMQRCGLQDVREIVGSVQVGG